MEVLGERFNQVGVLATAMTYLCTSENSHLRGTLDAPDGLFVPQHHHYVGRVSAIHPHIVVLRELTDESTCALYALDLRQDPRYRAIASNFCRRIFVRGPIKNLEHQLNSLHYRAA
jgi:hypothetical protein